MGYSRELSHLHASYFPANFTAIANARSPAYRREHAWPEELLAQVFFCVGSSQTCFVFDYGVLFGLLSIAGRARIILTKACCRALDSPSRSSLCRT